MLKVWKLCYLGALLSVSLVSFSKSTAFAEGEIGNDKIAIKNAINETSEIAFTDTKNLHTASGNPATAFPWTSNQNSDLDLIENDTVLPSAMSNLSVTEDDRNVTLVNFEPIYYKVSTQTFQETQTMPRVNTTLPTGSGSTKSRMFLESKFGNQINNGVTTGCDDNMWLLWVTCFCAVAAAV